ncbi:ribosome biogenesis GTPase Der [Christensenellaceae bacterium OttesenSCG-928-M15]|nr:ribosome biogenesis GTPase Der [Christensenellaceae bacterium OttesenSCG-928-M15]
MSRPLVAIVGRPNVGKSTFFNRILGRRIAIVEDTPGVTRDRIYGDANWLKHTFTLIDTGGIEPAREDIISVQMRRQAELAIEMADVTIFLVDGREGMTAADEEVADMLRRSHKPVILAVNKVDAAKFEDSVYEFYSLGLGTPFSISSSEGLGLGDLLDEVTSHFPVYEESDEENKVKNIAVVGKPNVGKSSIVNALLGDTRTIVSDIPGTTRDAIDTPFTFDGNEYILVDTAGIRRKRAIEDESIERYSVIRSLGAIRRADVVLIVVDAEQGLSEQDVRIAGYVHEEGKASVLIINKWDLIEKDTHTMSKFKKDLAVDLAFMNYVPMLFTSALTGQRVNKIIEHVEDVYEQTSRRITTGTLNDIISEAITITQPPSDKGRRLKIYYGTQVSICPPTFVIKVNDPRLMHFSYERYLENYLRKSFGLHGTPIRLYIRPRNDEGK